MRKVKKGLVTITTKQAQFVKPRLALVAMANPDVHIPVRDDISLRDAGKLDSIITTMQYNLAVNRKGRDRIKTGNSERIKAIANTIDKVQRMKASALDMDGLLESVGIELWTLYAKVEAHGLDDAHWIENLPCDDRQSFKPNAKRGAQGVVFHCGRKAADNRGLQPKDRWVRNIPDSLYPDPEDQYALLSVTDKMQRSEMRFADIDYTGYKPSKCKQSSIPDSHICPFNLSTRREENAAPPVWFKPTKAQLKKAAKDRYKTEYAPYQSVNILPPYESKAAKTRRLKIGRDALVSLASERKADSHSKALLEEDSRIAASTVRDSIILKCRAILATL